MGISTDRLMDVVHDKERRALKAIIKIYGDDTLTVLNGLQALIVRLALATGVEPEDFSAGMKHHWNFVVNAINEYGRTVTESRLPAGNKPS